VQLALYNMPIEDRNTKLQEISFSVDAGLINRLGRELVGRAETAVSELIKNAYDADARNVEATFINTDLPGGRLEISDDGLGMSLSQLKAGFMTISSTDKIHNPTSTRYNRSRAGKKGIGRFATQRLGKKLTIVTQTLDSEVAVKLTINWDKYIVDQDITKITNQIEEAPKIKPEGTTLFIEELREHWSEADIKRVYRYVSDLFQPDYLSNDSQFQNIAKQNDQTFKVSFFKVTAEARSEVASPQKMLFDKSLAIIEGYVDTVGDGFVGVKGDTLDLEDYAIPIYKFKNEGKFEFLRNVHFKAHYFIYNRTEYYTNISKLELNNIQKLARESAGVRLYRNGFRVLPYGEPKDDWLGLDIRYSGASGQTNIPFSNNNLFGFVEIIDKEGILFQETASREGLIENPAYYELVDFLNKAFEVARLRIAEKINLLRKSKQDSSINTGTTDDSNNESKTIEEEFDELDREIKNDSAKDTFKSIRDKYYQVIEELSMLRILASLGLTIGEFTHEIIQFTPSINGFISKLYETASDDLKTISILDNLKQTFANFTSYTSYFNATVSENTSREVKPILITDVVSYFVQNIKDDLKRQNTEVITDSYGYDLYTTPMHVSEWSSVLYNLYTNSKKAIKRAGEPGKIKIITGEESDMIYLELHDNGDGIPEENKERVFNAFFTTSTPAGFDAPVDEKLTGTGLGLKIVKDIVETYKGTICLIRPEDGYRTCFRIDIPKATEQQLEEYGI
jgi:signal transduction histidine kinase